MRPCVEKCRVFLFGKIKDIIIKNLVFKPLFVNKSILFSSYFSCFKKENKKEKESVFYKRKTQSCGKIIAKIAGNWLRIIRIYARSALYKVHSSFFNALRYAKGTKRYSFSYFSCSKICQMIHDKIILRRNLAYDDVF